MTSFLNRPFEYPPKWCAYSVSAQVLCTPYNHAPCHIMQSHTCKVYACLAVTCHLHFWQNDRDLLCATAVTRGWNGYRNKSQHRKLTLEKKILPQLLQGFEPMTFQPQVRCSNLRAIPLSYHLTSSKHMRRLACRVTLMPSQPWWLNKLWQTFLKLNELNVVFLCRFLSDQVQDPNIKGYKELCLLWQNTAYEFLG